MNICVYTCVHVCVFFLNHSFTPPPLFVRLRSTFLLGISLDVTFPNKIGLVFQEPLSAPTLITQHHFYLCLCDFFFPLDLKFGEGRSGVYFWNTVFQAWHCS